MVVNIHLSSITLVRCHASEHLFVIYYSRSLSLSLAHTHKTAHMAYFKVFGKLFIVFYLVSYPVAIQVKFCIAGNNILKG